MQVWLAAQRPGVGGVVLHSPLLSGVRVFNPNLRYWPAWADIFPNHLLVKKIDVPLLVMHGTADEVRQRTGGQRFGAADGQACRRTGGSCMEPQVGAAGDVWLLSLLLGVLTWARQTPCSTPGAVAAVHGRRNATCVLHHTPGD